MHNRALSWLVLCAFAAVLSVRAQAPAAAPAAPASPPPGLVLVAKVTGTATKTLNGERTALKVDDRVEQTAKINTGLDSSVVLAFSNGATTQLGADTEMVIDQFLQDPFASTIQVANLDEEPSRSNTKLSLNKGELVGKVAKLKRTSGSTFTVQTPVGAAGIRGTTFRIVFRPTGTGQAFTFQLSTVEGDVNFTPPSASGTVTVPAPGTPDPNAPPGTPPAGTPPAGTPDPNAPPGTPSAGGTPPAGTGGGVAVTGGQEVVITVNVNVNATTGAVTITAPPTVVSTVPISTTTQAAIVQTAQTIAVATASASFTSPPPTTTTSGTGTGGGTGTGAQGQGPSGSTTGNAPVSNNTPPSNTPPTTTPPTTTPPTTTPPTTTPPTTTPPTTTPPTTTPPVTTPPRTTSGDGRPGG